MPLSIPYSFGLLSSLVRVVVVDQEFEAHLIALLKLEVGLKRELVLDLAREVNQMVELMIVDSVQRKQMLEEEMRIVLEPEQMGGWVILGE
jgi:hypothetical protein